MPEALMVAQADADDVDDRILHRHLDMLTAPAGMALLQSGEDADRHMHAGAAVADRRHDKGRRVFRKPRDAHRAAHRLRDRLVALVVAIGSVGAKPLDRRVDQARVDLGKRVVTQPEPVERARPEILQQHVGFCDDLAEQALPVLAFQIERQAALVCVEQQEEEAVRIRLVAHIAPRDIAAFRLLELDDVGAQERQDLGAGRSRLVMRHIDDANSG